MKKVSFDFDSTLDRFDVQAFANSLINKGYDVWIVTSRCDDKAAEAKGWWWVVKNNEELYKVAEDVGIKRENIVFTEFADKIEFLKGKGFLFHLDDDVEELTAILKSGDPCFPMNVDWMSWREDLIKKFNL